MLDPIRLQEALEWNQLEAVAVGSLELVEVNPILDRENASAAIAVELAASALGQSIL